MCISPEFRFFVSNGTKLFNIFEISSKTLTTIWKILFTWYWYCINVKYNIRYVSSLYFTNYKKKYTTSKCYITFSPKNKFVMVFCLFVYYFFFAHFHYSLIVCTVLLCLVFNKLFGVHFFHLELVSYIPLFFCYLFFTSQRNLKENWKKR